jgi:hypothetical protein
MTKGGISGYLAKLPMTCPCNCWFSTVIVNVGRMSLIHTHMLDRDECDIKQIMVKLASMHFLNVGSGVLYVSDHSITL